MCLLELSLGIIFNYLIISITYSLNRSVIEYNLKLLNSTENIRLLNDIRSYKYGALKVMLSSVFKNLFQK